MKKAMSADRQGYTLIELLVVFSIVGILSVMGIVSYNDFNNRQTLKGAAINLKNDLRAAQNKALAGEKPTTQCSVLEGYEVRFPSATTYEMRATCSGPTYGNVTTYSLPTGVTFSPLSSSIFFKVLGQGVVAGRTICLFGFSRFYKLSVTTSGELQDGGIVDVCP